jgi:hypothetical protein
MAHVKYTGIVPDGVMFIIDTGIRDGHIVTGEFGHFGSQGLVLVRERS